MGLASSVRKFMDLSGTAVSDKESWINLMLFALSIGLLGLCLASLKGLACGRFQWFKASCLDLNLVKCVNFLFGSSVDILLIRLLILES